MFSPSFHRLPDSEINSASRLCKGNRLYEFSFPPLCHVLFLLPAGWKCHLGSPGQAMESDSTLEFQSCRTRIENMMGNTKTVKEDTDGFSEHTLPRAVPFPGMDSTQTVSQGQSHSTWEQHQQLPPLCEHPSAHTAHPLTHFAARFASLHWLCHRNSTSGKGQHSPGESQSPSISHTIHCFGLEK